METLIHLTTEQFDTLQEAEMNIVSTYYSRHTITEIGKVATIEHWNKFADGQLSSAEISHLARYITNHNDNYSLKIEA